MNQKIEKWDDVHGNTTPDDKMVAFLESVNGSFAILQLKRSEDTTPYRFASSASLLRRNLEPEIDHYEVVYTAPLQPFSNLNVMLEGLYYTFNMERPQDFRGHSLSVSDVVAIQQDGVVSCHFVDSIGFQELPGFLKPENYLKNAEMALEDDYGMIDGIVNNGKAERERPSVLEKLHTERKSPELPKQPPRNKEPER